MKRRKRSRSRVRNSVTVAAVGALTAGIVSIPASPAHAADTITAADQAYFSYYGLDWARVKGYTGEGVTIAMIDGPVDTSVPELKGAKITAKETCTIRVLMGLGPTAPVWLLSSCRMSTVLLPAVPC